MRILYNIYFYFALFLSEMSLLKDKKDFLLLLLFLIVEIYQYLFVRNY